MTRPAVVPWTRTVKRTIPKVVPCSRVRSGTSFGSESDQRHRHRAAQAGPVHDVEPRHRHQRRDAQPVGEARRAAEEPVDDQRPPHQDGDDSPGDRQGRVAERLDRDRQADQEERDRREHERQEFPDRVDGLPGSLREADAAAVRAGDDPGHDHRDDPGLVEQVGQDVGPVGGQEGERQLDQVIGRERRDPGDQQADARPRWRRSRRFRRRTTPRRRTGCDLRPTRRGRWRRRAPPCRR